MIYKNLHQIWLRGPLPEKYLSWIETTKSLHPDWTYKLWSGEEIRNLIEKRHDWFISIYDNYPYDIQRCDVARYFILYEYGGLYLDLDIECIKNVEDILDRDCVLFHQYPDNNNNFGYRMNFPRDILTITNSIYYAKPKNKFIYFCIKNLRFAKDVKRKDGRPSVMMSTSPGFMTQMYHRYKHIADIQLHDHTFFEAISKDERKDILLNNKKYSHINTYGMHWNVCSWNNNSWYV